MVKESFSRLLSNSQPVVRIPRFSNQSDPERCRRTHTIGGASQMFIDVIVKDVSLRWAGAGFVSLLG
jgi:hypothetical protein